MQSQIMACTLVLVTWATWMCPLVVASLDAENANCPTLGDENAMMQVQLAKIRNYSLPAQWDPNFGGDVYK